MCCLYHDLLDSVHFPAKQIWAYDIPISYKCQRIVFLLFHLQILIFCLLLRMLDMGIQHKVHHEQEYPLRLFLLYHLLVLNHNINVTSKNTFAAKRHHGLMEPTNATKKIDKCKIGHLDWYIYLKTTKLSFSRTFLLILNFGFLALPSG